MALGPKSGFALHKSGFTLEIGLALGLAILLANRARASATNSKKSVGMSKILHESFADGARLLLFGSMIVGLVSGDGRQKIMAPFSIDFCKGMLAFFLLDMGLMAAKNFEGLKG